MDDDPLIKTDILFGHVKIESRMRPAGNRIIGEGRVWQYDGDGRLTYDSGWKPTGCFLYWDDDEPRKWWEFWK